jgi:hypothetical protein
MCLRVGMSGQGLEMSVQATAATAIAISAEVLARL